MINTLRWNSLHSRRDTLRLQMMKKITHHIIDLKLPNYINYNPGITRGHDYKLTLPFTRIDPYKFSFFPATIALWNKLPTEIVNATSTDSFTYLILINFVHILHLHTRLRGFANIIIITIIISLLMFSLLTTHVHYTIDYRDDYTRD